jgi:CRP-like cAMP-binding protein
MDDLWNPRHSDLFSNLEPDEIDDVLSSMPMTSYHRDAFLFYMGDPADSLYLLQVGLVKVTYITPNGEEKILSIFQPGDVFGELFLGRYRHRIGQAQALNEVVVCKLNEADFVALIQRFPRIGLNLIRHLVDEQRETMARMHSLMRMDARHRLLGTLISLARRFSREEDEWFEIHPSLTQEDLSNMAGLNRSTVSSLINEFRRDGILGGTGRKLTVNRTAIEELLQKAGLEVLE